MKALNSIIFLLLITLVSCSDKESEKPALTVSIETLYGTWYDNNIDTLTVPAFCKSSIEESGLEFYGSRLKFFHFEGNGDDKLFDESLCLNSFKREYYVTCIQDTVKLFRVNRLVPDTLVHTLLVKSITDTQLQFTANDEQYVYNFTLISR